MHSKFISINFPLQSCKLHMTIYLILILLFRVSDRINDNGRVAAKVKTDNLELQTWADLPAELLELILSGLVVADNIRVSAVCKRWCSVASSVRVMNQSPWLMYFPKSGSCYTFYDPVHEKTHFIEFPKLDGCHVSYTKDGWLLLYRSECAENHPLFFFNPFTRELIKLPRFAMTYHIAAFSCAPTSTECVIFTVKHVDPTVVAITTCSPGANKWTTVNYKNCSFFSWNRWTRIVFSNGLFYCLSDKGLLRMFDPVKYTWGVLNLLPPGFPECFLVKNWWKGKFMIEHEGNIFVIDIYCRDVLIIFKLDLTAMEWKEVTTLDGSTLFAGFLSSHSKTYLSGVMRNSIYFSKVRLHGKRCISFSLDDHKYYPSLQCHDWVELDAFENMWVEPPKDFAGWM